MKESLKEVLLIACDRSPNTGEGRLFLSIVDELKAKRSIKIYGDGFSLYLESNKFLQDRVLPIYLFFIALLGTIKYEKVYFINYAPLWAWWLGILERAGVIIGPITGSIDAKVFKKNTASLIKRGVLQKMMCWLHLLILDKSRFKWAATKSVQQYLKSKGVMSACYSPPAMLRIEEKMHHHHPRLYDIFIYTSYHEIKNNEFANGVIKKIAIETDLKILYVGPDIEKYSSFPQVIAFNALGERDFDSLLSASKCYLTVSFEDAGITFLKALSFGVNVVCKSGVGFCDSKCASCYKFERMDEDEIIKKIYEATSNGFHYGGMLRQLRGKAIHCFERWANQ